MLDDYLRLHFQIVFCFSTNIFFNHTHNIIFTFRIFSTPFKDYLPASMYKIGIIEDSYEEKEFEWRITDFNSAKIMPPVFESPTFSFSATLFYVRLCLESNDKPGYSFFFLCRRNSIEPVEYDINLKNHHGNDEQVAKGVLETDKNNSGIIYFKTSTFVIFDTLTMVGRLKRGKTNFYQNNSLNVPKSMEMTSK